MAYLIPPTPSGTEFQLIYQGRNLQHNYFLVTMLLPTRPKQDMEINKGNRSRFRPIVAEDQMKKRKEEARRRSETGFHFFRIPTRDW